MPRLKTINWLHLFLALPFVALFGWMVYEAVLVFSAPRPRWVVAASGGKYAGPCSAPEKALREAYQIVPAADAQINEQTRDEVVQLAERVFARQYGIRKGWAWDYEPPAMDLFELTLPDGQRRQVWSIFTFIRFGDDAMDGEVTGVFIDSSSGEVLMLVTGQSVGDPCMTCGCGLEGVFINRVSRNQFQAFIFMICYPVLIGVLAALFRLGRFIYFRWAKRQNTI